MSDEWRVVPDSERISPFRNRSDVRHPWFQAVRKGQTVEVVMKVRYTFNPLYLRAQSEGWKLAVRKARGKDNLFLVWREERRPDVE